MSETATHFTCAHCAETFEKGWTDEEAAKESRDAFGTAMFETPQDVLCDDCYAKFMGWWDKQGVTLPK